MLRRRLALADGEQRREARLGGEQVVGERVLPGHAGVVADAEEVAAGVVERPEVHLLHERVGADGEGAGRLEERLEGVRRLGEGVGLLHRGLGSRLRGAVAGQNRPGARRAVVGDARSKVAERPRAVEVGRHGRLEAVVQQPRRERLDFGAGPCCLEGELHGPEARVVGRLGGGRVQRTRGGVERDEALVPRRDAARGRLAQQAGHVRHGRRAEDAFGLGERVGEARERSRVGPRHVGRLEQALLEREQRPGEVARVDRRGRSAAPWSARSRSSTSCRGGRGSARGARRNRACGRCGGPPRCG